MADIDILADRREFLRCGACALAGIAALALPAACGGGGDGPTGPARSDSTGTTTTGGSTGGGTGATPVTKFSVSGKAVIFFLDKIPELATTPSMFVAESISMLVIRAPDGYNALTAICTHEGCTVTGFATDHLVCPCHGSQYTLTGQVIQGPAPASLTRYTVSLDTSANTLTVQT
jgi:nitrite reductase/ring-hydroxylating ferredoxin subunit